MPIFYNQATLTYNNKTANSNVVTGELLEVLTITKTALNSNYEPGDNVTYVINIVNSGTAALTGLTLKDDLGAYTLDANTLVPLTYVEDTIQYFINGVMSGFPCCYNRRRLICYRSFRTCRRQHNPVIRNKGK